MKTRVLVFGGLLIRFWKHACEDTGACFRWIIEQVLINHKRFSALVCNRELSSLWKFDVPSPKLA